MIGFWIAVVAMTLAAVALLALPLLRRASTLSGPGGTDLAVYRDQLTELERERARGLIETDQADALEAEVGRRMLAASRAATATALPVPAPARGLAIALGIAIPVAALGIYLVTGHPELPAQPLAERTIAPDDEQTRVLAQANQLKATLKPVADSLDKWVVLGRVYMRLGRPNDAVDAFRVVVKLQPDEPLYSAMLAEGLVQADGGTVGEEARQRFAAIPASAGEAAFEARYYLALADAQVGKMVDALNGWQKLMMDSPADAPWIELTRQQIAQAAVKLGLNPMQVTPEPKPASAPADAGPTKAQAEAASKMTPEQQQQMIQGMVAKLAAQMEANPDDAAGWRKLANAYSVLGDQEKAKNALARAEAADAKAAAPKAPGNPSNAGGPVKQ